MALVSAQSRLLDRDAGINHDLLLNLARSRLCNRPGRKELRFLLSIRIAAGRRNRHLATRHRCLSCDARGRFLPRWRFRRICADRALLKGQGLSGDAGRCGEPAHVCAAFATREHGSLDPGKGITPTARLQIEFAVGVAFSSTACKSDGSAAAGPRRSAEGSPRAVSAQSAAAQNHVDQRIPLRRCGPARVRAAASSLTAGVRVLIGALVLSQHSGTLTARPPRLVSLNLTLISSPVWRIARMQLSRGM